MTTAQKGPSLFDKVGECLYRYRTSGVYYARFEVSGKEIRRSLKTSDRQVAKSNLADLRRELGIVDLGAGKVTLKNLCERFEKTISHQKPSTIEGKKLVLQRMKDNWPGGSARSLHEINPSQVQEFVSQQGGTGGKSLYNHYVFVVRAVFDLAVRDRLCVASPARALKQLRRDKPIRRTPSMEEFLKIVENVRAQLYNPDAAESADFLEFLGLAGLGQAEASSLTWADVDWERQQITTFRHKTSTGFIIPLYPQLRPFLVKRRAKGTHAPHDLIFAIKDAKKALAAACERLSMPRYSQRGLRRMFITRALEKGVDVKVIADWQGHLDGGKLILDTYSHVSRQHAKRMAQLMAD